MKGFKVTRNTHPYSPHSQLLPGTVGGGRVLHQEFEELLESLCSVSDEKLASC